MCGSRREPGARGGFTVLEMMITMSVLVAAVLGFVWGLGLSVQEVGSTRLSYVAANAARSKIEEMKDAEFDELYTLYGPASAGETFAVTYEEDGQRYTLVGPGDGPAGEVVLCTNETLIPGDFGWELTYDLNQDGDALDVDVSTEYAMLPVLIRISWKDGYGTRDLVLTSILVDPMIPEGDMEPEPAGGQ